MIWVRRCPCCTTTLTKHRPQDRATWPRVRVGVAMTRRAATWAAIAGLLIGTLVALAGCMTPPGMTVEQYERQQQRAPAPPAPPRYICAPAVHRPTQTPLLVCDPAEPS